MKRETEDKCVLMKSDVIANDRGQRSLHSDSIHCTHNLSLQCPMMVCHIDYVIVCSVVVYHKVYSILHGVSF